MNKVERLLRDAAGTVQEAFAMIADHIKAFTEAMEETRAENKARHDPRRVDNLRPAKTMTGTDKVIDRRPQVSHRLDK